MKSGELTQRTVDGNVYVAAPITVAEGQHWSVLLEIPESVILADAHSLRTAILVGAVVTMLLATGISRPGSTRRVTTRSDGWERHSTASS